MADKFHHENLYRKASTIDKNITICGCGAIGSNLAENLVRQNFNNITLIDYDRVELHNIGTQAYDILDLGYKKTAALATKLYDINDEIKVKDIDKKLERKNAITILKDSSLIIDAFDNTESRKMLKEYGELEKVEVLHAGLFEDYAEIYWNNRYIVPEIKEGIDVCDYPLARNIIILLTATLSETIVRYVLYGEKKNWNITLKDMKIIET